MLDPLISLSFSVQSNKGVYAALLGSGVSRSSRIPTGWEIALELVRKVAKLKGADCEPDPAAWYLDEFGKDPDYGEVLDAVARTPDERQALLRSYFEPSDEEREEGAKMPTKAHRAIAKLVSGGYIWLIVTTNFDRLMERALEDEGIAPVVVSGPDQLAGLPPLAHLGCCVIKVHGDYLDTRIRNSLQASARSMCAIKAGKRDFEVISSPSHLSSRTHSSSNATVTATEFRMSR